MPIFDFHCHLNPAQILENTRFRNISYAWLGGDHYKWRAMRTHGINERYVTGDADDREKFDAWARTIPYCIGNPLYHWTHLELARIFGMADVVFSPESAGEVYARCNEMLATDDFRARSLLEKMKVRIVCTTDNPEDSLESHRKLEADSSFGIRVVPTFRSDFLRILHLPAVWNERLSKLEEATGAAIGGIGAFMEAVKKRHDFFHENGCRVSDHAIEVPSWEQCTEKDADAVFRKMREKKPISAQEYGQFQTCVLRELVRLDSAKGWTTQLHIGALRNNNTLMFEKLGPDTGYDSISDAPVARSLSRFLDSLAKEGLLPRTVLYTLDPSKNETIATMLGNFQDGSERGKMQFGPAWWFNDQKDGMERHIDALASLGMLSVFIGMNTDSRSFLSFPRHEYFRRILCNRIGTWVENGELPNDIAFLGKIVEDVCYNNAFNYFKIDLKNKTETKKGS